MIDFLCEEIELVFWEGGWNKNLFYNMKFLDSVIKESQWIKLIGFVLMCCVVIVFFILLDSIYIFKGVMIVVLVECMWDLVVYFGVDLWDGNWFLKM